MYHSIAIGLLMKLEKSRNVETEEPRMGVFLETTLGDFLKLPKSAQVSALQEIIFDVERQLRNR